MVGRPSSPWRPTGGGGTAPPRLGRTYRTSWVRSRPLTNGCSGGPWTGPGNGSSPRSWQRPMRLLASAGPCQWTPPSARPTSMPAEPEKEAPDRTEPDDHPRCHSPAVRPGRSPSTPRPFGWPAARLQRRGVQAAQCGRVMHQPGQAVAGLAMRTDKLAIAYQTALYVAGLLIWSGHHRDVLRAR
jgi:hypothetical protein